jgi:hypothetical protein
MLGGEASFSAPFSLPFTEPTASDAASSAFSAAFSSIFAGVPTLEGSSDSSSITKAVSNSDGSGPLPLPLLSFGFGLCGLDEGESVREVDLRAEEADLDTEGEAVAFWRACSSAMRESIAPLIRFGTDSSVDGPHEAVNIT